MSIANLSVLIIMLAFSLSGCKDDEQRKVFDEIYAQLTPVATARLTTLKSNEPIRALVPVDSKVLTEPMVSLGRALFHDKRLSSDNSVSCATCHEISAGGDDGLPKSVGVDGKQGPINAPTVLNSGLNFRQFWDGRVATLAEQASFPVMATVEMGSNWDQVVAKLSADNDLVEKFRVAYGSKDVSQSRIVRAISRFEETLLTPSPFDKFLLGQDDAISDEAKAGYKIFKDYGCSSCHQGINVGGNLYQQFGVFQRVDLRSFMDYASDPVVLPRNRNITLVKVPSLRNIELTAPYFHTGVVDDLYTAVRVMGISQIGKDIPERDINLIVAFLKSLTGDWQQHAELIHAELIKE